MAIYGTPPFPGPQLIDGTFIGGGPTAPGGVAGGQNIASISGLTAAGTTQATALAIPSGYKLVEMDTVASSTGVNLPQAFAGTEVSIYNNGAQTLTVYPAVPNNPNTAAQDTINNGTSTTQTTHTAKTYRCAKDGVWSAQ